MKHALVLTNKYRHRGQQQGMKTCDKVVAVGKQWDKLYVIMP